ncbi:MAG: MBL fold metallo-hydrolase [Clostridia bacterium]
MTKYYSIASGSKGNCGLLMTEKLNILIDMGVSLKYLKESLVKVDLTVEDLDFVLITHEHIDHMKGIPMLCKKTDVPVYVTKRSFDFFKEKSKVDVKNINFFVPNETLKFETMTVETFKTPHDSMESVGFKLIGDDFKFSYMTDLGFMPKTIMKAILGSDMVVLEANYDTYMLEYGDYPYVVKQRIASNEGHLSNVESSNCVVELIDSGVKQIMLAHLSENNNTEQNVRDQMENTFKFHGIDAEIGRNVHIAPVKNGYPIINIKTGIEESERICLT